MCSSVPVLKVARKCAYKVGFSFLLDCSGNLFKKELPALRDVEANPDAIFAVMKVSKGVGRYSAHILQAAILTFYTDNRLFPTGLKAGMEVIDTWALRQANALQRLATWVIMFVALQLCNPQGKILSCKFGA